MFDLGMTFVDNWVVGKEKGFSYDMPLIWGRARVKIV